MNQIQYRFEYEKFEDTFMHRYTIRRQKERKLFVEGIEESELGSQSNSEDIFLYRNGGNAAPVQFHDDVSASLQDKIKQVNELSGNKLDHLRYAENDGKIYISFIFDWERAYGDTYHIVYYKSRDGVVKLYNVKNVKYDLKGLDDDWYETRIKTVIT